MQRRKRMSSTLHFYSDTWTFRSFYVCNILERISTDLSVTKCNVSLCVMEMKSSHRVLHTLPDPLKHDTQCICTHSSGGCLFNMHAAPCTHRWSSLVAVFDWQPPQTHTHCCTADRRDASRLHKVSTRLWCKHVDQKKYSHTLECGGSVLLTGWHLRCCECIFSLALHTGSCRGQREAVQVDSFVHNIHLRLVLFLFIWLAIVYYCYYRWSEAFERVIGCMSDDAPDDSETSPEYFLCCETTVTWTCSEGSFVFVRFSYIIKHRTGFMGTLFIEKQKVKWHHSCVSIERDKTGLRWL